MSIGYKNRKKRIIREKIQGGAEPHPFRNQLVTPRSQKMKQLLAMWKDRSIMWADK